MTFKDVDLKHTKTLKINITDKISSNSTALFSFVLEICQPLGAISHMEFHDTDGALEIYALVTFKEELELKKISTSLNLNISRSNTTSTLDFDVDFINVLDFRLSSNNLGRTSSIWLLDKKDKFNFQRGLFLKTNKIKGRQIWNYKDKETATFYWNKLTVAKAQCGFVN